MKNKTKKTIRIVCAVLLVVLLQTMGYTYAKYITGEKGSGQAEVAKWAFEIVKNGQQTKNIQLVNAVDKETLVNGKIAPGTHGAIEVKVDATGSEVDMEYSLEFSNEQNKPNNIRFTYNGKEYKSLSEIKNIKGTIEYDAQTKTRDIVVYWEWYYETGTTADEITANDKLDVQDANSITKYTFDLTATGTQVQ